MFKLKLFHDLLPEYPPEDEDKNEAFVRSLVARFARGNFNLQQGRYITQKQVDELKAEVLAECDSVYEE